MTTPHKKSNIRPSLDANELKHRAAIKEAMKKAGISISAWARQNGFERHIVEAVLAGRLAGSTGQAYQICVALRLKAAAAFDPAKVAAAFQKAA